MALHNGQGITSYGRSMARGIEGQIATNTPCLAEPYVNPLRAQVYTVAVGGTASDGDYTITVTENDGTAHAITYTADATGGDTNADIAAGLRTAAGALASLLGVATASGTGTDVVLTFDHTGTDHDVATTAAGTGTLTATETTAPGGSALPMARFVVDGGDADGIARVAELPDGATADDLVGVSLRDFRYPNGESRLSTDGDKIPAGAMVSVMHSGHVIMKNVGGAVTKHSPVYVVVATAGGNELGQARGDADGANTVALDIRVARWNEDVAAGAVGPVYLNM